jgi:hypothetical protein
MNAGSTRNAIVIGPWVAGWYGAAGVRSDSVGVKAGVGVKAVVGLGVAAGVSTTGVGGGVRGMVWSEVAVDSVTVGVAVMVEVTVIAADDGSITTS